MWFSLNKLGKSVFDDLSDVGSVKKEEEQVVFWENGLKCRRKWKNGQKRI